MLVGGEAGVGKTSVLDAFSAQARAQASVLWGACEALQTPRPFGPLQDIARGLGEIVRDALAHGESAPQVFDAVLECLRVAPQATVLIFEDVHWADHGTLDLIRFLARRLPQLRALLVLSYRHDEVGADHPLRVALGDAASSGVKRITLAPLSEQAVQILARAANVAQPDLYTVTGGNAFFVTELIATLQISAHEALPNTVRDAVLARLHRLPEQARAVMDVACVVPGKIERWLVREVIGSHAEQGILECLQRGVLLEHDGGDSLLFRHELARRATLAALAPSAMLALHQSLLKAQMLRERSATARLVHHAIAIGEPAQIVSLAQRAAEHSAKLGAHREAAAHYATALRFCAQSAPQVQAQLNESWSYEAGLIKIDDEVIAARQKAIDLWRSLANMEKVGLNLRWLSRLVWYQGKGALAARYLNEAVEALESVPPCAERAWAYSVRSQIAMLNADTDRAITWGEKAIALADQLNVPEVRVHSLNNIGAAMLFASRGDGLPMLEESLALARKHGFHEQAARVFTNVASYGERFRRLDLAKRYAVEGIAFDREHDLDSWTHYLEGILAQIYLNLSQFELAQSTAEEAIFHAGLTTVMRLPAETVLAYVALRSGGDDAAQRTADVLEKSLSTREAQRILPTVAATMEAAWLAGKPDAAMAAYQNVVGLEGFDANAWDFGACEIWRHRLGEDVSANLGKLAAPYAAEVSGEIEKAVSMWQAVGDTYAAALVLANGAAGYWPQAIEIFDALNAKPAAQRLRELARAAGVKGIKRGVYAKARDNAFGLTAKESDVLRLIVQGKSNAQISEQLFRSIKTIEHHSASVLAKLNAKNRAEATAITAREKLFDTV